MNKKSAIIFFLVLASVAATWFIEQNRPTISPELQARMDQLIQAEPRIKSYVWNRSNLSVGVLRDQVNGAEYALSLCRQLQALGAEGVTVQVVDVLKLQKSGGEEWEEIGYKRCE